MLRLFFYTCPNQDLQEEWMNRVLYLCNTSILRCWREFVTRVYYGVEFVTQLAHGAILILELYFILWLYFLLYTFAGGSL
ncbi:hypothetical protein [Pontibacter chinhatensis]|uniref:hypothetical protein n=1 Tax=Pontibacter chinhatensis TaxID=1436961 RepID=UPI001113DD90|nr:hypothetical protein [Pontibacter chinhatensis]